MQFPIRERGIQVDVRSASAIVTVNRVHVQEVLINLIRNAVEAVESKTGTIEISATMDQGVLEFVVADNGPGADEPLRSELFKAISSSKPDGMGIGLAVSKSIVESHGGKIWHSKNLPVGAKFHFTLPTDS